MTQPAAGGSNRSRPTRRRAAARRTRLQADPRSRLERLLQLRDLVHDHLGPRRLLHDLRQAWNNGGPIAISLGLADHLGLDPARRLLDVGAGLGVPDRGRHLLLGVRRSAAPAWGWFTGWFNLIGLVGVVASVVYASAQFLNVAARPLRLDPRVHQLRRRRAHPRARPSCLFALILTLHSLVNIYSSPLVARSTTSRSGGTCSASR